MALCLVGYVSCSEGERVEKAHNIVINELMPQNRTGLLNDKGKAADWIELKNMSADTIDLKGFQLEVERLDTIPSNAKDAEDKVGGKVADEADAEAEEAEVEKEEKKEKERVMKWIFPDVKIPAGKTLLVFASKKKNEDEGVEGPVKTPLSANLKLPKEGAVVRFLSPHGKVIREMKYDRLEPDQSLALQSDSTYRPTYWQSPGYENTREGYKSATINMDAQRRKSPLLIWEVMSRAEPSHPNWVELKNVSDHDVDLSQYSLSKKISKKKSGWQLPARTLKPGEIVKITFAGKSHATGPLSAPFKPGDAETIVLSKNGRFVDGICARLSPVGGSIGRAKGKNGFFFYPTPTPGAENGTDGRRYIAGNPEFNYQPGVYGKEKKLVLRLKDPDRKVHYTLDGSLPGMNSPLFKDSLVITKNAVVRSFAEGDNHSLRSDVATATYIMGVKHDMPVVNISVRNSDLYDFNNGIYANGPGYGDEWPHTGANFWKKWTKRAHVEIFDGKETLSRECGLRIFGGFSRNEVKKSLRLKFRHEYGDAEVDFDFFGHGEPVSLKDLVLRSGSQDFSRCMLRDEFFTSLMHATCPTLLIQDYRPVALYVNGEYFGLYYFREKIDKNFVARKLGVSNDNVDIIISKYLEEGSKADYDKMMNFVKTQDMKDKSNYEKIKSQVDLQGLVDYKLGQYYSGNADAGNVRFVRSSDPGSDKKWRFAFFDLDATWVGYKPSIEFYLSTTGEAAESNVVHLNVLINRLLQNPEFRAFFLQRFAYHLENTFSPKNAEAVFDNLVKQIRPEMRRNCERWPQLSYEQWEKNIEEFKVKFKDKPRRMLDEVREYLKVTPEENKKYFSKLGY